MTQGIIEIQSMLDINNGLITATQITNAGIPRRCLSELVVAGKICKVDRGIYATPDVWEDEMYILQYRFSKGVFSHGTALYLHDMTDRTPHTFSMTFPHGYNAGGLKNKNVNVKYVTHSIYDLGISDVPSPYGNNVKTYDIERTLCDIVKGNNTCDIQMVNTAMKAYAASSTKDIGKLVEYAERLRVKPRILTYMEILL